MGDDSLGGFPSFGSFSLCLGDSVIRLTDGVFLILVSYLDIFLSCLLSLLNWVLLSSLNFSYILIIQIHSSV